MTNRIRQRWIDKHYGRFLLVMERLPNGLFSVGPEGGQRMTFAEEGRALLIFDSYLADDERLPGPDSVSA